MAQLNPKALTGMLTGAGLIAATFFIPFESDHPIPYADPPGVATDCVGHTLNVKMSDRPTPHQCALFLASDTKAATAEVERDVKVKISKRTEAAFISFEFNEGAGTFRKSSMVRDSNDGHIANACEDMAICVKNKKGKMVGFGCGWAGNERLPGLIRRRLAESKMCMDGIGE